MDATEPGTEPDAIVRHDGYRTAAVARALGVPLEPGERIVCVAGRPRDLGLRLLLLALGVATLVLGVGVALIVTAIVFPRYTPRGQIVTDRRLVLVDARGVPSFVPLAQIDAVRPGPRVRGLRASERDARVSRGWHAAVAALAAREPAMREEHWVGAESVRVLLRDGRELTVRGVAPELIGRSLAAALAAPEGTRALPPIGDDEG